MQATLVRCVAGSFAFAAVSTAAYAQTTAYPANPVRLVVPFPAGVDSMGRILRQRLTESLGKQIVIDDRAAPTEWWEASS